METRVPPLKILLPDIPSLPDRTERDLPALSQLANRQSDPLLRRRE